MMTTTETVVIRDKRQAHGKEKINYNTGMRKSNNIEERLLIRTRVTMTEVECKRVHKCSREAKIMELV